MSSSEQADSLNEPRLVDADALAQFIQQRRGQLLAYIENQLSGALRTKVEPEDVLQDVSAEACRTVGKSQYNDRSLMAWLCQIAQHRIVDLHRHHFAAQKRSAAREVSGARSGEDEHAALVDLLAASMTTASQAFSRNEKEMRLWEALAKLPAEQSNVLQLRYGQGLASKEIAAQIGKSDGAVRVMLTRALNALREQLGPLE